MTKTPCSKKILHHEFIKTINMLHNSKISLFIFVWFLILLFEKQIPLLVIWTYLSILYHKLYIDYYVFTTWRKISLRKFARLLIARKHVVVVFYKKYGFIP